MKELTKKIIATEILLFISCIFLGVLVYISLFTFNYIKTKEIESLQDEATKLTIQEDSLKFSFKTKVRKQRWIYNQWESNENFTSYRNEFHFWLRLKELNHKGIIVYNWNNKWDKRIIGFFESIGFKSPNVLIKFIDNNSINSIDLNQMRTANSIRHDINNIRSLISMKQASIVDYSDQLKYAYLTLLFLLFILYPIRYLLKLIIWCLKVLIN